MKVSKSQSLRNISRNSSFISQKHTEINFNQSTTSLNSKFQKSISTINDRSSTGTVIEVRSHSKKVSTLSVPTTNFQSDMYNVIKEAPKSTMSDKLHFTLKCCSNALFYFGALKLIFLITFIISEILLTLNI